MKTKTKDIEKRIRKRIANRIRYVETIEMATAAFKDGAAVVIIPDGTENGLKKIILARNKFARAIYERNESGWLTERCTILPEYKKRTLPTYIAPATHVVSLIEQITAHALDCVNNGSAKHSNRQVKLSKDDYLKLIWKHINERGNLSNPP